MKTVGIILLVYALFISFDVKGSDGDPRLYSERLINLRGVWKFTIGDNMDWADPNYDDSSWEEIYVPSAWEDEGFNGYDGYAWYRVAFEFTRDVDLSSIFIELGYVDDVDEVYINGHLVGFSGGFPPDFYTAYSAHRKYPIPEHALNLRGPNVIAVRVFDTVMGGGIVKGRVGIYQERVRALRSMSLAGVWKISEGKSKDWLEADYDDEDWQKIMVPGFWQALKKHWRADRSWAVYRTEFVLPADLRDEEELVLVLGKIDDFDRTYLNGQLIGFTKDGRPYGSSGSYQQHRIYVLLDEFLNRDGPNVLAVEVEDMGGNAGIWEGPVGIVSLNQYEEFID
ncbi:MAG: beta galactosidase jelly roll domain-containing protein [Bacteroidota bacterium]